MSKTDFVYCAVRKIAIVFLVLGVSFMYIAPQTAEATVLQIGHKEFVEKFNKNSSKLDSGIEIIKSHYTVGEKKDSYRYELNITNIVITAIIDKKAQKPEFFTLTFIRDNKKDVDDNFIDMYGGIEQLMVTVSPKLTSEEQGEIFLGMKFIGSEWKDGSNGQSVYKGIKYTFASSDAIGVLFFVGTPES